MITGMKPSISFKRCLSLHKSERAINTIKFKPYEYELESYINLWLKKNHFSTLKDLDNNYLEYNLERIENENEIIIKIVRNGISKSLRIDKLKLKEVKV